MVIQKKIYNYLSRWVLIVFIIWVIGYLTNIKWITNYINPTFSTLFVSVGFTVIFTYLYIYKKLRVNISLFIFFIFIHYFPFFISYKYAKNPYSIHTFIVILLIYTIYMKINNKNIYSVYINDKYPQTINEGIRFILV